MTENQSHFIDPLWRSDLSQKVEVAQVRERRVLWQPRYEAFASHLQRSSSDTGFSVVYSADYTGPHFPWMIPDNLPDYLLYRLDTMERQGGSEVEQHWRAEQASARGGTIFEDGTHLLHTRLVSLSPEIAPWGRESLTDLHQVQGALNTPPAFAVTEPPPVLTPRQASLLSQLQPRADRYNDARWQRWTRKAGARRPGAARPRSSSTRAR